MGIIVTQYKRCPCGGKWKFYHGWLGYESLVCSSCGQDINDLPEELS